MSPSTAPTPTSRTSCPPCAEGEGEVRLDLDDLRLVEGTYLLDVAAHRSDGTPYDYHRGLYSFRVKSRVKDVGVYRPAPPLEFTGGAALEAPAPRPELDLGDEPSPDAKTLAW